MLLCKLDKHAPLHTVSSNYPWACMAGGHGSTAYQDTSNIIPTLRCQTHGNPTMLDETESLSLLTLHLCLEISTTEKHSSRHKPPSRPCSDKQPTQLIM